MIPSCYKCGIMYDLSVKAKRKTCITYVCKPCRNSSMKTYNLVTIPKKTPEVDPIKWKKQAKASHKNLIDFYKDKPGYSVIVKSKENSYGT